METVFISWYEGGEVFRSGLTWQRGAGRIFYFRPGHETYPIYHNAGRPAGAAQCRALGAQPGAGLDRRSPRRPNVPVDKAPEPIVQKGARLHADGERGCAERRAMPAAAARHRRHRRHPCRANSQRSPDARSSPASIIVRRRGRRPSRAKHGIPSVTSRASTTAIAWGEFDAAINVTPDAVHKATTLALLAAGKHVLLREAAGAELCRRAGDDRGGRSGRRRQHGQPHLPQLAGAAEGARAWSRPARSANCAMSRRPTCRAGWSARHWGDWRTRTSWLWRLSTAHGSTGVLGDVGIHILDFATYGAADDIVSLQADLRDLPQGRGRSHRRLPARRQ